MVQWLLSLPKNILVIVVLAAAIILIVAYDPPHTICRTQIQNFKSRQKGVLYKDPNIKTRRKPLLVILIENCKKYNTPGSCYSLFSKIKTFINGFKVISVNCYPVFSSLSKVREALFAIYDLMIRIAWGDKPPLEHQDKLNWFADVDISLFCLIKEKVLLFYGKNSLLNLERKVFKKLPGTENMSENRIRELSIVSENCSHYPSL